ncbi:hypothetical protein [Halomarina rubra]|uniref:Uncharacterized protein n=1 Tax=Halomarina rubra TaxID=2071873 RepID=A0ABD6ATQ1_9EURY|nr:hypothetical protein [Halomarina rubra]
MPPASRCTLTGRCERCDWQTLAGSHPEMVRAYRDHLREHHPERWVRV